MKTSTLLSYLLNAAILLLSYSVSGQTHDQLKQEVLEQDSLFWHAYNTCDSDAMEKFFSEDIEFYHDKNGVTKGLVDFMKNTRENLCGNSDWHLRRQALDSTISIYPMEGYGAILSGEHIFFVNETDKPERLDGLARFTHLWKKTVSGWKMTRILSYDHRPAPQSLVKSVINVPKKILAQYVGNYETQFGTLTISLNSDQLHFHLGKMDMDLLAESETQFFDNHSTLSFEFIKGNNDEPTALIVKENGVVVEQAKKFK